MTRQKTGDLNFNVMLFIYSDIDSNDTSQKEALHEAVRHISISEDCKTTRLSFVSLSGMFQIDFCSEGAL